MVMSPTAPVTQPSAIAPANNSTLLLNHPFLQQFLAHYLDGVMIVSDRGELLYANSNAIHICDQLCSHHATTGIIPDAIKAVYAAALKLGDSQTDFLEDAEVTQNKLKLRVRSRRIEILASNVFCILIILEDRRKIMEQIVNNEVREYNLTHREKEVRLLHRLDYSYQEIARELYISINTVKKHLKSISMKQKLV